jgi:hypothetical protein
MPYTQVPEAEIRPSSHSWCQGAAWRENQAWCILTMFLKYG